jgi:hypothetical protein
MDARRRQAVQDWLDYRASREGAQPAGAGQSSPPLSMEEIRRRAVEAWRSLQARGAESNPSAASVRERDAGGEPDPERVPDKPGLADDFSV